jgi:hypothetical protein
MARQSNACDDETVILGHQLETDPILPCGKGLAHAHFLALDELGMVQKHLFVQFGNQVLESFPHAVVVPALK